MDLDKLLNELRDLKVDIEERVLPDETRVIIASCALPVFPYGGRHVWYPLVLPKGRKTVDQKEVNALVRHLCHAESRLFKP
jgi:hypothetical protein